MKKPLIALVVALVLTFAGCSCGGLPTLSFEKRFVDNAIAGYTEVTQYTVKFKSDFADGDAHDLKQSAGLNEYFTPSFQDGTYTSTVKIIDQSSVPNEIVSDVLDTDSAPRPAIIYQKTEFAISGKYTPVDGEEVTFNDFAKTESYFRLTDTSLAPVYSIKSSSYTMAKISNANGKKGVETISQKVTNVITYNKGNYVIKTYDYDQYNDAVDKSTVTPTNQQSVGYSYRTCIDNTSLLFAIRNISLAKDASMNVPTVSPTYGSPQTLGVKNYDVKTTTVNQDLQVNGVSIQDGLEFSVDCLSFALNSQNSGKAQLVYVQKSEVKDQSEVVVIPNKALMVKYVSPLSEYGSYLSMGVLEYNLTSVTYQ